MKRNLSTAALIFSIGCTLNAQWTGTNPVWTNNKVGIGTSNPSLDLEVGSTFFGLQQSNASPNAGYLRFGDQTGWKFHIGRSKESPGSSINTTTTGVLFTIQDNGNVGIGTISPNHRLTVTESATETVFGLCNTYNYSGNRNWALRTNLQEWGDFGISQSNAQNGNAATAGTVKLYISGGGNVGIGTTSPNHRLTVTESATETVFGLYNTYNYSGNRNWALRTNLQEWGDFGISQSNAQNGNAATAGTVKLYISGGGNVSIGTINPGNYQLNVNGRIRANEVVVNTTGADFVFDPDYKLPDLRDVEKYIKDKKHLPDLAPASEMKENGMNVSEMQTKLLQKIEELTLYVIELKKELNELKNK